MKNLIVTLTVALMLGGCLAATPTSTATDASYLAWHCYGSSYDAQYVAPRNWIFYAADNSDGAVVNLHGDDIPARFQMDGLDAQFYFGDKALIIQPDGRAQYGDIARGRFSHSNFYYCNKAKNSR